jgi:choline dehydrogenase-like flavoprotein
VRIEPADFGQPKSDVFYGAHHMGTTRMHADPRKGVVDAQCRAHGMSNLSIAGSSVFPAVGFSNPTLTILALALRIADNVRATLA